MSDSFKHIEDHFKQSMQGFEITGSTTSFAKIMSATNKKLFFKFVPKRFNVFYLSAAVVATTGSVAFIINSTNDKEPVIEETIQATTDSLNNEKTINFTDSLSKMATEENEVQANSSIQDEYKTEADTLNLSQPKNPVASSSKEVLPETIIESEEVEENLKNQKIEDVEVNADVKITEEDQPIENETNEKQILNQEEVTISDAKTQQVDSVVVIEKEDVLIKNSELKVKKQTVKQKGR